MHIKVTVYRTPPNGLAAGMVPVVMAYAGEAVHKGKEAESMGIYMMMFYLGLAVGPLIGGIFWHAFGMASVFYVMSGISAVAFLLVLPFLPEIKNYWLICWYNYSLRYRLAVFSFH